MKLTKSRIKNYKSIIDSGDCYINPNITTLLGKNEVGKTAKLEALEDFNFTKQIREEAQPINASDEPEIALTFNLERNKVKEILYKVIGQSVPITNDVAIQITKNKAGYILEANDLKDELFDTNIEKAKKFINKIWNKTETNSKPLKVSITFEDLSNLTNTKKNFKNDKEKFFYLVKKQTPNFILFSSFDDILPSKIPFSELETNPWIQYLSLISDLSIDTIKGNIDREKAKHKDYVNIKFSDDYKQYWTQDVSTVYIEWDSDFLYFWIKEDGQFYEPKQRSKGRQWHLSFYIKISAKSKENPSNIILIDEPGTSLHANAQKDILKKLEDSGKNVQIVFSTHSPYLLELDKLNRVRLVTKTRKGTRIEEAHKLADKETLTPIVTVMGFNFFTGISGLDKQNNVICEGISDKYYLDAFQCLRNRNIINFINGGGVGNMFIIGTILLGWGCKVSFLLDNDKGGKDGKKNLKSRGIPEGKMLFVPEEGCVEDVFSPTDFKKFVIKNPKTEYPNESNSKYVKQNNKLNKVWLAKIFLEDSQNNTVTFNHLDKKTQNNIQKLFKNIETQFNLPDPSLHNPPKKTTPPKSSILEEWL